MTQRLTVLGALTCLLLATMTLTGPAAHAAWTTSMRTHGAKLQLCKEPLGDGRIRVKVRLDNRGASHAHVAGMSRTRGEERVDATFRTAAGRLSGVKSLVWQRGDYFTAGMGEITGEGAGGDFLVGDLARC
ncbi:hypothetical protein [Nocardioides sp. SR21]|uniref:hypothetical protein n=1 Tax=Nocardioides sp. SR21 TaxID=2919501 RepID=UPI001FA94F23|nr:hypothetical protein [Nocardioides sp. SR21]